MDEKEIFSNMTFTSYDIQEPFFDAKKIAYLVYQEEICPKTKRNHFQGYVEFKKETSYRQAKRILKLKKMPHFEARNGTQEQAAVYCKKDDTRKPGGIRGEHGKLKCQGERSDLISIQEAVLNGLTFSEILRQFPKSMRLSRCIKDSIEAVWGDYEGDKKIRKHREAMNKAYKDSGSNNKELLAEMLKPPY